MSLSKKIFAEYGEKVTIAGTAARGFVSPIDDKTERTELKTEGGVVCTELFRLLTDLEKPHSGDTVLIAGREYEILRVLPVRIFGTFSHSECIVRARGGAENA